MTLAGAAQVAVAHCRNERINFSTKFQREPIGLSLLLVRLKCKFLMGSAPGPAASRESLQRSSAPPDPLACGEGARCPLSKNPLSAFDLQFRPFGLPFIVQGLDATGGGCRPQYLGRRACRGSVSSYRHSTVGLGLTLSLLAV